MSNLNFYNTTTNQWEAIKVDTKLNVQKSTVTLSAAVNWIYIGISTFNPANDTLYVVKNGNVLAEGIDYTFNTASLKIFSIDGSNWSQGSVFTFSVWKNTNTTLPSADGGLLQDGSVTDVKLAMPITPALTNSSGTVFSTLKDRLLDIDSKISGLNEQMPFIFVTNYIKDVTNIGTGTEDWTNAIQNALNASPQFKQVILPAQTCRITKTLEVPCGTSLVGFGNATIIQPDFGYWQTTDYRAIHIATREGINYEESSYNQYFENFSVVGKNNSSIQSIGIDIKTPSTINMAVAVNFAVIFANFRNILVSKFDTAWNLEECWATNFFGISVLDSRVGFSIKGKVVNCTFNNLQMTNFKSDYTSNTGKTYGVLTDYKTTYNDGQGRPEGLIFSNSLIFGANTNLYINNLLFGRFTNLILDGASEHVVIIGDPAGITIQGCYIYTSGNGFSGVEFLAAGVQDSNIRIIDNYIIGTSTGTQYGIHSMTDTPRYEVTIGNNLFQALSNPISLNYFGRSNIVNNYGKQNSDAMIYLQSDCGDTKVDGNTSSDNLPILRLHPTTSHNLQIGDNASLSTRTSYQGVATIPAGQVVGSLGNNFYGGTEDLYYRAVTFVQPLANLGIYWVRANTTGTEATIQVATAPTSDTKVYYRTIAVPYSATT